MNKASAPQIDAAHASKTGKTLLWWTCMDELATAYSICRLTHCSRCQRAGFSGFVNMSGSQTRQRRLEGAGVLSPSSDTIGAQHFMPWDNWSKSFREAEGILMLDRKYLAANCDNRMSVGGITSGVEPAILFPHFLQLNQMEFPIQPR